MKKIILYIIPILLIISCNNNAPKSGIIAEEVWDNYLNNHFPKNICDTIKTSSTITKISSKELGEIEQGTLAKSPDKWYGWYKYPDGTKLSTVYNNGEGFVRYTNKDVALKKEELAFFESAATIFPALYYRELDFKFELLEDTIIDDEPLYYLNVSKTGFKLGLLIDKKNYICRYNILKNQFIKMLEYKNINGFSEAKRYQIIVNKKDTLMYEVISSEYNKAIPDSIFSLE